MSGKAEKQEDEPRTPKKHKYFKEQFDEEEVKLVFRKHPIVMRKGLILFMFAILLGVVPAFIKPTYAYLFGGLGAGFLLGILVMTPSWVKWYFSIYIMTDMRFIQQSRSIFQTNVVDLSLEQVQMINYQIVGIQETLMGFGTIIVQTYVGDLVIKDVHHPAKVQKKMVHILRELGVHPAQKIVSEERTTQE